MYGSRNLTPIFLKLRAESKQKKNRFGYSLLNAPGLSPSPPNDQYSSIEMAPVLPVTTVGKTSSSSSSTGNSWSDLVKESQKDFQLIKERIQLLQKIQQKRLLNVFDEETGTALLADNEIDALSSEITKLFRSVESKIRAIQKQPSSNQPEDKSESELRNNSIKAIAGRMSKLNEELRNSQKSFMREVKRRQGNDIVNNTDTSVDMSTFLDAALTDTHISAMDDIHDRAIQRSEEINKIAKSVIDLNRLFKDLSGLVIEQGSILDRIDYNLENVQDHTKNATIQLVKAEEQQRSSTMAIKCILILIAIIFINLLILTNK
jgi:syntaxin 16